jgi:predicted AAA+ superfamily ATPase
LQEIPSKCSNPLDGTPCGRKRGLQYHYAVCRGQRAETFVACHLLKAVDGWTDLGLGSFELRYLRDKLKREVDFLVVRDRKPWFLVEVKTSATRLSDSLASLRSG